MILSMYSSNMTEKYIEVVKIITSFKKSGSFFELVEIMAAQHSRPYVII